MSTESERLAELVTDLGRRLADAFGDVISPEAQRHLRNAQREALTALFMIYEEQMGRRTGRGHSDEDAEAEDRWPRDMEEAVRGARAARADSRDGDDREDPGEAGAEGRPRSTSRRQRGGAAQARKVRASRVKKIELD